MFTSHSGSFLRYLEGFVSYCTYGVGGLERAQSLLKTQTGPYIPIAVNAKQTPVQNYAISLIGMNFASANLPVVRSDLFQRVGTECQTYDF